MSHLFPVKPECF
jgi:hypothetical protein